MPKCTFITKVEKAESDCPIIQVAKDDTLVPPLHLKGMAEKIDVYFETETIKAQEFKVGVGGRGVYIGLCREAQDAIGVWLESFENLQKSYYDLHNLYLKNTRQNRELVDECNFYVNEITALRNNVQNEQNKLNFYRNMNFWQRLKFLFKIW